MKNFRITNAAAALYDIGISFHASGVITDKDTGAALYDFYKVDSITPDQKQLVLDICNAAVFIGARAEYAPEQKSVYICFPKAEMRRRAKSNKNEARNAG